MSRDCSVLGFRAASQADLTLLSIALNTADDSQSFAYDKASQECKLCAAGTYRDYAGDTACIPW